MFVCVVDSFVLTTDYADNTDFCLLSVTTRVFRVSRDQRYQRHQRAIIVYFTIHSNTPAERRRFMVTSSLRAVVFTGLKLTVQGSPLATG